MTSAFLERGIFTQLFRLFICVRLIIRSIRKNLELDLILFILRSSRRAKRLHTPSESTLSPGEQDIGRNDLLPLETVRLHVGYSCGHLIFIHYNISSLTKLAIPAGRVPTSKHWHSCVPREIA